MLLPNSQKIRTIRSQCEDRKTIDQLHIFLTTTHLQSKVVNELIRYSLNKPIFSGWLLGFSSHGSEVSKKMDLLPNSHVLLSME